MTPPCIAHTPQAPGGKPHDLREHLHAVAELAAGFAAAFDSADWGRLAGLWHDLGKYQPAFQDYLLRDGAQIGHSIVGAAYAARLGAEVGTPELPLPLVFGIAGHHGGLPNAVARNESRGRPLEERLEDPAVAGQLEAALAVAPADLLQQPLPPLPPWLSPDPALDMMQREKLDRRQEMWIRFLFSALVDADFLDTERYHDRKKADRRLGSYAGIPELLQRLDDHLAGLTARAKAKPSEVNRVRAEVLSLCRESAEKPPGIFSLNVPTGGGKTLSGMSFALQHAENHELRRVIVVVPFTSIIEQNAEAYREALGKENVLEHHSNLDPEKDADDPKYAGWRQLASENWDAPVVVTTAVQFFESLFANRTSRCRKLHRVAKSVVLLDEVQTLPPDFLRPILEALDTLRRDFGCTLVLSTATQPALERTDLPDGLSDIEPIIDDPHVLARRLQRVRVDWPDLDAPAREWDDLATELAAHRQVLAIVHRRSDARELAELLPEEGRFHLSGLMCAAHRSQVLERARNALKTGRSCRLVSTQLIEAGVDVDFPVVYRALGPLDSIIQAAGRCNREGRLPELGRLVVYRAPTKPPSGTPKLGLETLEGLLRLHYGRIDLEDPDIVRRYFKKLYSGRDLDRQGIAPQRNVYNFATVGRKFRIIPKIGHSIVVHYSDKVAKRLDRLRDPYRKPSRKDFRALQPFMVTVYDKDFRGLEAAGALEEVTDGVHALVGLGRKLYSKTFGLNLEGGVHDPDALVV